MYDVSRIFIEILRMLCFWEKTNGSIDLLGLVLAGVVEKEFLDAAGKWRKHLQISILLDNDILRGGIKVALNMGASNRFFI